MKNNISPGCRRRFIQKSAVVAGSGVLGSLPYGAVRFGTALSIFSPVTALAQVPKLETLRLTDKLLFVKGPNSNVLVADSDEGLIMVDGGHADWFGSLHEVIAANFPGRPYRAVFNTHWHREQTGSNLALGEQGVEIIAHENTRLWLSTEVWQRWSDTIFPPLPEVALPKTTFIESGTVRIAERNIRFDYLWNAHTDGDISVYFEEENVLVGGGLVSNGQWPIIDWWTGGYIGGMLDSFVSLLTVPNEDTRIIPAYGNIMTLEQLKAQNQMYLTIFDRLHGSLIKSYSLEDILAEKPTAEYDAEMGDSTQFITQAFHSFQGRIRDPQNFRLLNIP